MRPQWNEIQTQLTPKRIAIFVVLLVLLFIHVWFFFSIEDEWFYPNSANKHRPDAIMDDVIAKRMDKLGRLASTLYSPKMIHYNDDDTTTFSTPHYIVYSKKVPPWHLHANRGIMQGSGDKVDLYGDVKIHQDNGIKNVETTLTTTELTLYPNVRYAETEKPVKIVQPGRTVTATGMRANMNTGFINLLHQAHGEYLPSKPPTSKPHA